MRDMIRTDQQLGAGLRRRIGVARRERPFLGPGTLIDATVNLVGADLMEAFNTVLYGAIQERIGPIEVRLYEFSTTHDRTIDMTFGGEIDDDIRLGDQRSDRRRVTDIPFDKAVAAIVRQLS